VYVTTTITIINTIMRN